MLPLAWPSGVKPLDLPNFETQARTLRYQALGMACRDNGCKSLMLGHHEDDQAETLMMRLASGHSYQGLSGMQPRGAIPECGGIHGVYRSGTYEGLDWTLKDIGDRPGQTYSSRLKIHQLENLLALDRSCERGGIAVCRPLLKFSKRRLVETCKAHLVEWEEDKTNQEFERTPRNTIRKFFEIAKLPVALRKESMLALADRNSGFLRKQKYLAKKLFLHCEILVFDIRSGGLVIRLPKLRLPVDNTQRTTTAYKMSARLSTAFLLRRLIELVSPFENINHQSLKSAVMFVYPELHESGDDVKTMYQPSGFTACGVQFQRLPVSLVEQQTESSQSRLPQSREQISKWHKLDSNFVWRLTRQPYSKEIPSLTISPSMGSPSLTPDCDLAPPDTYPMSKSSPWSPWQFWDGRYWIRVLNRSFDDMVVRPFQPADLQAIEASTGERKFKALRKLLTAAAPEKSRWTLPVIAEISKAQPDNGKVLVLPTLGPGGILDVEDNSGHRKVEWQVRYKKIDLGHLWETGQGLQPSKIERNQALITSWND